MVSPNKTLEGLVGGGLGTIMIGALMWWIAPFSPQESAAMAASCGCGDGFLGRFGDACR